MQINTHNQGTKAKRKEEKKPLTQCHFRHLFLPFITKLKAAFSYVHDFK